MWLCGDQCNDEVNGASALLPEVSTCEWKENEKYDDLVVQFDNIIDSTVDSNKRLNFRNIILL